MNRSLVKHLYWIIPGTIIIFGLVLLFYQNFSKVTEPPAPNWSGDLSVGRTDVSKLPPIEVTKNGDYILTSFEEGRLATTMLNHNFVVQDTKTYDIPVDKWTQVYQQDDNPIYFDYTNIYDKTKKKIISDVEGFYPLKDTIFYVKENVLYQLSPENKKSTKLMEIDLDKQKIIPQQNKNGVEILTYTPETDNIIVKLHHMNNNGKISTIYQEKFKIGFGKMVDDVSFALDGQKLAVMLKEQGKVSRGKPQFYNYLIQTELTEKNPQQREIIIKDPAGKSDLTEISNIVLKNNEGNLHLLFQANGQTQTQYNDNTAINIYKSDVNENGTITTERRSNTPEVSLEPQWINDTTIAWLDLDADGNEIKVSSSDIAAIRDASGFNGDDWTRALGKTMGMLAASIFALAISSVWFIWPIIFIAFMYFFRSRTIDRDPIWVFYAGIGIYAIGALVFKSQFFVDAIYTNAPSYLTFDGSSYVYMFIFAAVSLIIVQLTKWINGWDGTARIMYFVGLHILLLTTFFGPYLI